MLSDECNPTMHWACLRAKFYCLQKELRRGSQYSRIMPNRDVDCGKNLFLKFLHLHLSPSHKEGPLRVNSHGVRTVFR